jgi:hypothetical protein
MLRKRKYETEEDDDAVIAEDNLGFFTHLIFQIRGRTMEKLEFYILSR